MTTRDGRSYVDGVSVARTAPPARWPAPWREAWAEPEAIAWEGGAPDPAAVADADLDRAIEAGDL